MDVELLSLLTAASPSFEAKSSNHDAITREDIAHFLGTKNLTPAEYSFLLGKYTEDHLERGMFMEFIMEDIANIYIKSLTAKKFLEDKTSLNSLVMLAMRETMEETCFACQGVGFVVLNENKQKCMHCEGTGQFIYNDKIRAECLYMSNKKYMMYKKAYYESLEYIKNIESSALSKIGDTK